ncbi:Lead, cadmium, zinc and mercury transporting ATPase [Photobacterium marinum]|uniref:P-type Zn(2+) transporter n=1 Tax=Photobacterium marinum TaxID=1056511 RepID=L8JC15_9GAMM|nr:zinc/cadmium/mercury/lead-transporting ATPase [Photobacterium marinum]ELR64952.1 Lead, cadmium, zinc and mercury transporting ATPase [Photobacterium marinum]
MCAQCNNKKTHIHTVQQAAANASSVRVEHGVTESCCCSAGTATICYADSESSGDPGSDDDPAGRKPSFIINSISKIIGNSFTFSIFQTDSSAPSESVSPSSCRSDCCSDHVNDVDEQELEKELLKSSNGQTLSWKIQNMDCPSCARKLEKALSVVDGLQSAKVLFATQKLVVSGVGASLAIAVEEKAKETGFPLVSARGNKEETENHNTIRPYIPVLTIAVMMAVSVLINRSSETYGLIAFTLTTLIGLISIVKQAINLAKGGTPFSIETLMTVAAVGALYLGETAEAAMVLLLFLIGEQLEGYASARARSGVKALMDLVPEKALVICPDGTREKVAAEELKKGDVIEVAPGGRLPADAVLTETSASFDESALTGESVPVERLRGEKVMAGCLVSDKQVQLRIVSEQGDNAIDRILHLIEDAESRKAPLERFIDRFSRLYTPAMIALAALVIVIPPLLFGQGWSEWIYKGLTLLLIACPCALVISIPAAITSGLAAAAQRGALIKGGAALEQLGHIETVAFDKTGTLTQGKPVVTDVVSWDGDEDKLLYQAAAVEDGSLHPLAQAVVNAAQARGLKLDVADEREALPGKGIQGVIGGDTLLLAAADRLPASVQLTAGQKTEAELLEGEGKTLVVAVRNDEPVGLIAWRDNLRNDTREAIKILKAMGIHSVMLTGDNPRAAAAIAREIDIDYRAGLLPADKVTEVELANKNAKVAMVGDGINDAPAMKTASIGIAMGGGTDVALETADAALTHNRISELPEMIALSRATLSNIRQNIFIALGLKGVFLVTTLLGLTGLWVAVLADSGATALVTLNALRLLRFESKVKRT